MESGKAKKTIIGNLLAACIALALGTQAVSGAPIFLKAETIEPSEHPVPRAPAKNIPERGVYLLQCPEAPTAEWLDLVQETGAIVRSYIPENAYIVQASADAYRALTENVPHTYLGPYRATWRLDEPIREALALNQTNSETPSGPQSKRQADVARRIYKVLLFDKEDLAPVSERILQIRSCEVLPSSGQVVLARLTLEAAETIASWAEVHWIEQYVPQTIDNNVAVQSPRMNVETVWPGGNTGLNLTGKNQIVAVADTGLDTGDKSTLHNDVRGRVIQAFALGRADTGDWSDLNGHGTHVVGSLLGNGTESDGAIKGLAYEAKLVFQSLGEGASGKLVYISDNEEMVYGPAYMAGARIHSDSWGDEAINNSYTEDCRGTDNFMFEHPDMLILRSAGNNGQDADKDGVIDSSSLNGQSPAKNCISVGNAENYRERGGKAGTRYGDWQDAETGIVEFSNPPFKSDYFTADPDGGTIQGMAATSSRGPCSDGRIKPDIVAPGQQILSLLSSVGNLPGDWNYYDFFYCYKNGTSMSTPLVAGAAALVRQWLQDERGMANPDGATIKAVLLAGAKSLSPGQYGTGSYREIPSTYPNNVEGWGQANLGNSVANGNGVVVYDAQVIANGEEQVFTVSVPGRSPLSIVMAYTDAPADPGSKPSVPSLVNNLDMTVTTPSGTTKYPNSRSSADNLNNVEGVRIASAEAGTYTITIKATKITTGMDSALVGGKRLATRYSLVANGAEEGSAPPPEEPLTAPTSVSATTGTDGIIVTWSGGSGAESYNVWRGTTSSRTASTTKRIKTGATSPYPDNSSDLEVGRTYYYWIEAVRGTESQFSSACSGVKEVVLSLGSTATLVGNTGGDRSFTVTANTPWSATVDKPWVTLTQANGTGNGWCEFSVEPNSTAGARVANIVVTAGNGLKSVTNKVNQTAGSGSAPDNDLFANPQPLDGQSGYWEGSNKGAGMETSETVPTCRAEAVASVWFTWTAPATGTARFETRGKLFDVVLAVWQGTSVSALTSLGCSDDRGGGDSNGNSSLEAVEFPAVANTTYRIALYGDRSGQTGNYTLEWSMDVAAETVSVSFDPQGGASCSPREYTVGDTYGGFPTTTKKGYTFGGWYPNSSCTGEPVQATDTVTKDVTKLYAKWTPITYRVNYELDGGSAGASAPPTGTFGTTFGVSAPTKSGCTFEGWTVSGSWDSTTAKWGTSSPATWSIDSGDDLCGNGTGTVYFQNLASTADAGVTLTANWIREPDPAPANDNFSNPQLLTGSWGSFPGHNAGATMEESEPTPSAQANSQGSVWFKWTAPESGVASFDTFGSSFDTVLGVWTGNSIASLAEIKSSDDAEVYDDFDEGDYETSRQSQVVFDAVKGTPYRIAVYGYNDERGDFTLSWTLSVIENVRVTFESNGGTACEPCEYTVGDCYGYLPEPTKKGYTFDGWYSDSSCTDRVWEGNAVTKDVTTLYAKWVPISYSVSYALGGGTAGAHAPTDATFGTTFYVSAPTKADHEFSGWTVSSGLDKDTAKWGTTSPASTPISGASTVCANGPRGKVYFLNLRSVSGSVTLLAGWTLTNQTVTFNANGGTCEMERKKCRVGDTYGPLPVASKAGNAFLGWFTEANGGEEVKSTDKVTPSATRTLWAHWTNRQVTTFKGNGGSPTSQKTTNTIAAAYGTLPMAQRAGHAFLGWYTEAEGGTRISTNTAVKAVATRTFYAHWTDQAVTTFKGNGGKPATQKTTNTIGTAFGTLPEVEWANHVFLGWYTEAEGGSRIATNSTVKTLATRTFWAHWSDQQVVTFKGNGGTPDTKKMTNTIGKAYGTLPTPSWSGHAFLGWFTKADGGSEVKGTDKATAATSRTLYAHWTNRQVTTFKGNGGSPTSQKTTNTIAAAYGRLPTAQRAGHAFLGWYTEAEGGTRISTNTAVKAVATRTFYAHWTDQAVTTFKGNGGKPATQKTTNTIGTVFGTLPEVEWANHVFLGWYTEAEGGSRITTNSTVKTQATRTFWARWSDQQVVTFKGNGGTPETKKMTNTIGKAYGTLPTPSRSGHAFLGWFTKADGGSEVKGTDKATTATARTLYAHWTDRQVTTFKGNGGSPTSQKTTNTIAAAYGRLPTAQRAGHAFLGWYTEAEGGTRISTNTAVKAVATRTFYAHWTDQAVTTFKGNGGKPATQKTTNTIGTVFGTLPEVEWANHVFLGWYTESEGGAKITTNSTVKTQATRTFWARWSDQQVVTFKGNGGTPETKKMTNTIGKAYGTLPTPSRSGHAFLGWFTKTSGGSEVKGSDKATPATSRTLWAHWTNRQVTTFKGNGGSPMSQKTTNTIAAAYGRLPTAQRAGHAFLGWYTESEGGTRISTNTAVKALATRTFYAHWTDQAVTTFKGNGGKPATQKTTNTIGTVFGTLPEVAWSNHVFLGWYTEAEGGSQIKTNSTVKTQATRTFWAHWSDRQVVTFKGNGGTPETQKTTNTIGTAYGTLPEAAWANHVFLGWYTEAQGGSKITTNSTVKTMASRTFFAHWTLAKAVKDVLISGMVWDGGVDSDGVAPRTARAAESRGRVCTIRFDADAGTEYEIQWTPSLVGEWCSVAQGTTLEEGPVEVEVELPADAPSGFFRVMLPSAE